MGRNRAKEGDGAGEGKRATRWIWQQEGSESTVI